MCCKGQWIKHDVFCNVLASYVFFLKKIWEPFLKLKSKNSYTIRINWKNLSSLFAMQCYTLVIFADVSIFPSSYSKAVAYASRLPSHASTNGLKPATLGIQSNSLPVTHSLMTHTQTMAPINSNCSSLPLPRSCLPVHPVNSHFCHRISWLVVV